MIENAAGLPIYVHAELGVIDDVWAAVGSANAPPATTPTSWTPTGVPQRCLGG